MIPFGDWLPDQPEISGVHLRDAKNVIPSTQGYKPFKSFSALSNALAGRVRGAAAFRDEDGNVHFFAGDDTKLYELQGDSTWSDVSRTSGGAYTTTLTSRWRATQYGDLCLFTNFDDVIQSFVMSSGTNFAALAGSPPKAKHIATLRDFVVVGYTDNSAQELAWSGIDDPEFWTQGTNQSDRQILPDGGYIQGFATGDVLLIFQQKKIRVMQYVGPPIIMQIDVIEEAVGCLEANSICQHGRKVFYLADDGFHMIDSLQAAENIGEEKVNDWFFSDVNESFLYRMSSSIDPDKNIAYWCYPSQASAQGTPDTILIFYWPKRQWAYIRIAIELVFNALTLGYTLEGLDAIATSGIDLFTIPLDDPILQGGSLRFGAFSSSYAFGVFTGSNLEATIETGDFELIPARRAYVSGVRPVTDADDITVSVAARERAMDSEAYTSNGTLETHGMASVEASGRYHRSKLVVAAADAWTFAQGFDFEFAEDGDI